MLQKALLAIFLFLSIQVNAQEQNIAQKKDTIFSESKMIIRTSPMQSGSIAGILAYNDSVTAAASKAKTIQIEASLKAAHNDSVNKALIAMENHLANQNSTNPIVETVENKNNISANNNISALIDSNNITTSEDTNEKNKTIASKTDQINDNDPDEDEDLTQKDFFSNILGFKIDSIYNPKVFENTIDWLKTPYHYGGNSRSGIDCSGFVSVVYKNSYNITLGSSAASIFNEVEPEEIDDLKEGDLLFFKIKRKRISHIAVYLGNNKFAHASTQAGVIVSDLDERYYKKRFYKAGRHRSLMQHLTTQ